MLPSRYSKSFLTREVKLFLLAVLLLNPASAFAAADWAAPAVDVFESLESGMVKIGTVAVGVGLVGYGVYSAVFGEMRWQKMFQYILGAVLIVAAPTAIRTLVNLGG
ncbi:TrbC/VirB2 family protein [Pseudovibrio brasiliensis]|uniref:TrbC/VirB2 family protein n=1 Tax=Pseudovibrio brasiliensis TaxID=1898042 RepID=A0ABX8B0X5_9HYPH|nr:TrbC/VirB2 family protein [Pseudovibrio brasiliensis]QUS59111.1 TrbC/VirB2 family protein [Pseudovibrio brasiliensis]